MQKPPPPASDLILAASTPEDLLSQCTRGKKNRLETILSLQMTIIVVAFTIIILVAQKALEAIHMIIP
jgi:hypothetical protein